jgi:chemosensory pili system protein ChpA (sensor histidine kinase/response regulator)
VSIRSGYPKREAAMRQNEFVIVVADDDEQIRQSYTALFEAKGYTVHACADGTDALATCRKVRPAVALLDLEMPGLDGYEVAKQLRGDPDLAHLRIVAVTGRADERASALAWDAGFHDFLAKPAPVSMLLAMVRSTRELEYVPERAGDG